MLSDFSLIVGTLGRNDALKCLLDSIDQQTECSVELLLMDQSAGKLDLSLLAHHTFPIRRIITEPGLSRSRNIGMKFTRGNILAFPDDDCFYPAGLLKSLKAEFVKHPEYDGISVKITDTDGRFSAGGYMSSAPMRMTHSNIWRTANSSSLFFRESALKGIGFDEKFGINGSTMLGSGEETDFCLQLIEKNKTLFYCPDFTVFHPVFKGPFRATRGFLYGLGVGGVLRKRHYSIARAILMASYQIGRAVQRLCCLQFSRAYFHFCMAIGRFLGFFMYNRYINHNVRKL